MTGKILSLVPVQTPGMSHEAPTFKAQYQCECGKVEEIYIRIGQIMVQAAVKGQPPSPTAGVRGMPEFKARGV